MKKASEVFESQLAEKGYANTDAYARVDGITRSVEFHSTFGMPVNQPGYEPTVSDRLLRAKLLLEETLETITKGLGLRVYGPTGGIVADATGTCLTVEHREGDLYDPVETLDGLADVKVIANGTATALGLPMKAADYEVFCSNMTKMPTDGKPIVNREVSCKICGGTGGGYSDPVECYECDGKGTQLLDPKQPVGKVLKPDTYTPANIRAIIEESK